MCIFVYLRVEAGDDGVGDALRYDGEGDGRPGDGVGYEVTERVLGPPLEDGHLAVQLLLREGLARPSREQTHLFRVVMRAAHAVGRLLRLHAVQAVAVVGQSELRVICASCSLIWELGRVNVESIRTGVRDPWTPSPAGDLNLSLPFSNNQSTK